MDGIVVDVSGGDQKEEANIQSLQSVASTLSAFQIRTNPRGYNCGRKYCLQAKSDLECEELIQFLKRLSENAKVKSADKTLITKCQERARDFHNSPGFQLFSALLIFAVRPKH